MLLPISNTPRDYAWGSTTRIAELEGRAPTGAPEAESWYGDYAGSPARVDDGSGRTLDTVLSGAGHEPLPYLMKLLATDTSLSIQAHPTKAQAVAGFSREEAAGIGRGAAERTYRDDNHKPEIIVALSDPFIALVGLREIDTTRRLLRAIGDGPGIRALLEHLDGPDPAAALRATLEWALSGQAGATVDELAVGLRAATSDSFAAELATLRRIAEDFPGDAGLIVAAVMNLVVLHPGQAVFAPAGVLHAYQEGLGVEVMAASDNVLRGGLTPKHIDVAQLLEIVDTTPGPPPLVVPDAVRPGVEVFDVGVPDFRLTRVVLTDASSLVQSVTGPAIALAVAGAVSVRTTDDAVQLSPGRAVYISPEEARVELFGPGTLFLAEPGGA